MEFRIPDVDKNFMLETAAIKAGIGAIRKHEDEPIKYIPRSLSKNKEFIVLPKERSRFT
jgi:hypothetical protein